MFVRHLSVADFRSWASAEVAFDPGPMVLVGANGQGKTNLIEAIGYLSTLSSHRVPTDAPLVRTGLSGPSSGRRSSRPDASCVSRSKSHPGGPTGPR